MMIFLDETNTPTTMTPLRARSPRGTRVVDRVPRGKWERVPLLATLTSTGLGPGFPVTGALDRDAFAACGEELLVPSLPPSQTMVRDYLSVPKSATARALIEAAGCGLCLRLPATLFPGRQSDRTGVRRDPERDRGRLPGNHPGGHPRLLPSVRVHLMNTALVGHSDATIAERH
jgi:hypothetical protein